MAVELPVRDAGLDGRIQIVHAHPQHLIHAAEIDRDPARERQHLPLERGPGAERHQGDAMLGAPAHDLTDLFRGQRKGDGVGPGRRVVGLAAAVMLADGRSRAQAIAKQGPKAGDERVRQHGRRRHLPLRILSFSSSSGSTAISSPHGDAWGPGTIPAMSGSSPAGPSGVLARRDFASRRRAALFCCFSCRARSRARLFCVGRDFCTATSAGRPAGRPGGDARLTHHVKRGSGPVAIRATVTI